jgi:hypothetical protein
LIRHGATDTWDDKVAADRFTGKGGRFVRGRATIIGPGRVRVNESLAVTRTCEPIASARLDLV